MLKKAIRYSVTKIRGWLHEENVSLPHDFNRDEFLYPWLNAQFLEILEGNFRRRDYAWGVQQGVYLASKLGMKRVSVIEFGVAGGRSLVELERIAERVERLYDVQVDVYGFDRGVGLPKPIDHRDVPNLAVEGYFQMDEAKLRARLKRARLLIGPVERTIPEFIASKPAPVAFVAVDLVLYSSTVEALKLFDADLSLLLPRVHAYFDDLFGFSLGDCNGELLAILEFNAAHQNKKLSKINGLRYLLPPLVANASWVEKFWIAHLFEHPLYSQYDGMVRRGTLQLDEWD